MLPGSYFLHIITSVLQFKYAQSKHQHFQLVMKLATPWTFLPVVYRHVFLFQRTSPCCVWEVMAPVLQPIQYEETCQLVDHNYNLSVLSGPTWTKKQRNAGCFFFSSSTSNPRGLPNPMSDKSVSHCVFFEALPVQENELLLDCKNIYILR